MTVEKSEAIYRKVNGEVKRFVKCSLYSTDVPGTMPGAADIPGYRDTDQIFPGSTLYIVSTGALYMANEAGVFVEQ